MQYPLSLAVIPEFCTSGSYMRLPATDTWDTYYGEKYWLGSPFIRAYEEDLLAAGNVFQVGIQGTLNDPGDLNASLDLGFHVITMKELHEQVSGRTKKQGVSW